jgi:hypothetical protein
MQNGSARDLSLSNPHWFKYLNLPEKHHPKEDLMTRTQEQKDLLQKVIDWLKVGALEAQLNENTTLVGFNFTSWVTISSRNSNTGWCGTTGCIAGAAVQFATPDVTVDSIGDLSSEGMQLYHLNGSGVKRYATELLGLADKESDILFLPFEKPSLGWTAHLMPEEVAITLQHFQDTNEIDWELAR